MSNKKALVVGAGRQGRAIAFALGKLGIDTLVTDIDPLTIKDADRHLRKAGGRTDFLTMDDPGKFNKEDTARFSVVVSSAPYYSNLPWAAWARSNSIPYCDLGGNVEASKKIQELPGCSPVFTDIGLAPGLVNIIAEELFNKLVYVSGKVPTKVVMAVGGLPVIVPEDDLKYRQVFSMDGLLNEYQDTCKVLRHGIALDVDGMSEVEPMTICGIEVEMFNTSGGMAHSLQEMKQRGVTEMSYKTIRYPGHKDAFVKMRGGVTKNVYVLQRHFCKKDVDKALAAEFNRRCPPTNQDAVVMFVEVGNKTHTLLYSIVHAFDDNWTAMQKLTAFPVACIAAQMAAKDEYERACSHFDRIATYGNVNYGVLNRDLKTLGVSI